MRGVYTAGGKCAAVAAAKTLLWFTAPGTIVIEIIRLTVTDESNATNYQAECSILKGTAPATTGYTQLTAQAHEPSDKAAGTTAIWLGTGAGADLTATTTILQEGLAILNGWDTNPWPEERLYVSGTLTYAVRLNTTPAAATDLDVRLTFKEIG